MGQFVIEPALLAKLVIDKTERFVFPLEAKLKTKKKKSDKVSGNIILDITKL
jgi:hypothetical protein